MTRRILALFSSTRAVIKADQLCREKNIVCTIIPVPREISSECGMAIELTEDSAKTAEKYFTDAGFEFEIHYM